MPPWPCRLPETAGHHGLAHLKDAEILYESRLFPEQAYPFKHALTHIAYSSLGYLHLAKGDLEYAIRGGACVTLGRAGS
jgi:hypothetical protein